MVISSFLSIYLFEVYLIYKSEIIEQKRIELKKKIYKDQTGDDYDTRDVFELKR